MAPLLALTTETDEELLTTLYQIDKNNFMFLFEKCKQYNINARQLRFIEHDHLSQMIPPSHLGLVAEFHYHLRQWKLQNGYSHSESSVKEIKKPQMCTKAVQTEFSNRQRCDVGVNTMPIELPEITAPSEVLSDEQRELFNVMAFEEESLDINSNSVMNVLKQNRIDPHGDNFPLELIIPSALTKTLNNYKSMKLLTEKDRRLLASSIVNFFESSRIKMRPQVMQNLAEQIAEYFPTESKKVWYDRQNCKGRGRLYMRYYNSHRSKDLSHLKRKRIKQEDEEQEARPKPMDATKVHNVLVEREQWPNQMETGKRIRSWLISQRNENISDILELWREALPYRLYHRRSIKDEADVREFLAMWPSYKWPEGHQLLAIDFDYLYPQSLETFHKRWRLYKEKIVPLLEAEVKDINCMDLLAQYQSKQATLNEDTKSFVLLHLLHAITKPYRVFKTSHGSVRYCIYDSQYSVTRYIRRREEIDEYRDPHPCIFVCGPSLMDIAECWLCFEDVRYRLSFEQCLMACMQMYCLLRLEDPLPSLHFWQFVRSYLFDIHKANERPYAIMETVIQYMETAAQM